MKTLNPPLAALFLLAPAALVLAACDAGTPEADTAAQATPAGEQMAATTASPSPATSPTPLPTAIPAAMQGRWGLVSADCEPGRDDAKGLLTIDSTKLDFYESVGTLGTITEADGDRLRTTFDFMGEGQEWQRDMQLALEEGGRVLVRTEYGEDAAPAPLRYTKCG